MGGKYPRTSADNACGSARAHGVFKTHAHRAGIGRLCLQSIMASPGNQLVHQVVERHGLQAIFRLMSKPRVHKPAAKSAHQGGQEPHSVRSNSSATTPSPDKATDDPGVQLDLVFPLHGAPKTTTKLQSPVGEMLNTASTPTVFALTDMQKRRLCGKGVLKDSRSTIAKLLREMQPIVVRREPSMQCRRKPSGALNEAHLERDPPSPALSSATTTSHSSLSSEPVLRGANELSPPPLLTSFASQPAHSQHNRARTESIPVLAAVQALLALSTTPTGKILQPKP
jgi:hypothetical protein